MRPALVALAQLVFVSPLVLAQSLGAAAAPEGFPSSCHTNLQGLGICMSGIQLCGADCDAATPCPDGTVCIVENGCTSALAGTCQGANVDGGCSNPGTFESGFEPCEPVVFHEDFGIVVVGPEGGPPSLDKLSVANVCGTGGTLFKETACTLNAFASSPLEAGRWGVAPSDCSTYATAQHRVVASTPAIDVSGCARARLDFDYALFLHETGTYDRVFVTVGPGPIVGPEGGGFPPYERVLATNQAGESQAFTEVSLSCAGAVVPVGNLVQDGAWHHFHAALGEGPNVQVKFWVETFDDENNTGQGFLFDDVRIDCSDLIFDEGFEGANFLRWSFASAPPPLIEIDFEQPGSCATFTECGGPGSGCVNMQTADGPIYCISLPSVCGAACKTSEECGAGMACVVDTCCNGGNGAFCVPAVCNPGVGT